MDVICVLRWACIEDCMKKRKYWLETIGGWLKGMMSDVLIVCFGCHSNKGCCHVEQKFKLDVLCCGFGP